MKTAVDEIPYVRYKQNDKTTHILCKKVNAEPNKMWILWAIEEDGSKKKIAQGANPTKLEDKIDYIKAIKDSKE